MKRVLATAAAVLIASSLLTACAKGDPGPPPLSRPATTKFSFDTPASTASATTAAPKTTVAPKPIVTPRGTTVAWTENFAGRAGAAPDPTLLQFRIGGNGWGNKELQTYTARSSNASLDGKGNLAIKAVRESYTGADKITRKWTSARLDSLGLWSFSTGTLAVRLKLPSGAGTWPAFWLEGADLPTVGWPKAGEIDVVEALGGKNAVYQSVHGPDGTVDGYAHSLVNAAPKGTTVSSAYHVFSVTRTPDKLVFRIDGALTGSFTPAGLKAKEKWAFNRPMFMIVNLAVGGWPGPPTAATPSPSSLLVDWIRFTP